MNERIYERVNERRYALDFSVPDVPPVYFGFSLYSPIYFKSDFFFYLNTCEQSHSRVHYNLRMYIYNIYMCMYNIYTYIICIYAYILFRSRYSLLFNEYNALYKTRIYKVIDLYI